MTEPKTIRIGLLSPIGEASLRAIGFVRHGRFIVRQLDGNHCFTGLFWREGEGVAVGLSGGDQYLLEGVKVIGDVLQFIRLLEGGE